MFYKFELASAAQPQPKLFRMLSLLALCQRLAGSDLRADRWPKATHRKRGRLGDATLPAVRAPDKRQAMELRMVVSDAEPTRVMSALG
jgi:hypothetical protein